MPFEITYLVVILYCLLLTLGPRFAISDGYFSYFTTKTFVAGTVNVLKFRTLVTCQNMAYTNSAGPDQTASK